MSLGNKILNSSLWMLSWQWLSRLLGVISLIILARLLTPDDYGIIFKAAVAIAFVEIVTVLGADKYLINKVRPSDSAYDTAWTLRLIQYLIISIVLFLSAGKIALFMDEPAIVNVLRYMAIGVFFTGFENIGIIKIQKEMDFRRLFYLGLLKKVIGFVATLIVAFIWETYWALVVGVIVTRLSGLILSYIISDYRPRICLLGLREQWQFSKWILVDNVAVYLRNKSDMLFVAQYFDVKDVGQFGMAASLSELPTTEIITPIQGALYPGLAAVSSEKDFRVKVCMVFGIYSIIIFPIMFGMALVSNELIYVALGEKWMAVAPLVIWLTATGAFWSFSSLVLTVLQIKGKVRYATFLNWMLVMVMLPIIIYFAKHEEMLFIVIAKFVICYLMLPIYIYTMVKVTDIKIMEVIGQIYRPLLSSIVMYFIISNSSGLVEGGAVYLLTVKVLAGFVVYSTVLSALHNFSKSDNSSAEIYVWNNVILRMYRKLSMLHN